MAAFASLSSKSCSAISLKSAQKVKFFTQMTSSTNLLVKMENFQYRNSLSFTIFTVRSAHRPSKNSLMHMMLTTITCLVSKNSHLYHARSLDIATVSMVEISAHQKLLVFSMTTTLMKITCSPQLSSLMCTQHIVKIVRRPSMIYSRCMTWTPTISLAQKNSSNSTVMILLVRKITVNHQFQKTSSTSMMLTTTS